MRVRRKDREAGEDQGVTRAPDCEAREQAKRGCANTYEQ